MVSEGQRAYAEERFGREIVAWLTTVRPGGQPVSSPVWFWWDGRAFWIWSMPGAGKVANLRANRRASLHLEGDGIGGAIVTMEGTVDLHERSALELPGYMAKYHDLIVALGHDDETFAAAYSAGIRFDPARLRVYEG